MDEKRNMSIFGRLPKGLRITLIILSIITIVYWALWLAYKVWSALGRFMYFVSEKHHWWIFTTILLICAVTILICLEISTDIDPFTNLINRIKEFIKDIRDTIADKIRG